MTDNIRLLIVDDEKPVRDLIKLSIPWDQLGVEVAGEASSAMEALDIVEESKPDLVITDICMPMMDGVELGRQIIEKDPLTKVIILTGHDEFDYAARSIKAGITDFLLKPLDEDELTRVAAKIITGIKEERKKQNHLIDLQQYLDENREYLQERYFNSLLFNLYDEQMDRKKEWLGISIHHSFFQIAVIETIPNENADEYDERRLVLSLECRQLLRNYFEKVEGVFIFFDSNHQNVILCNNESINITELLEEIKARLISSLKCWLTIGIGNSYSNMEQLRDSYNQANQAIRYKVVAGKNQVINYSDVVLPSEKPVPFGGKEAEEIRDWLMTGQQNKAMDLIDSVFNKESMSKPFDLTPSRFIASTILSSLTNVIMEFGLQTHSILSDSLKMYGEIFKTETISDIHLKMRNLVQEVFETLDRLKNNRVNSMVLQVEQYLAQHFQDSSLSLTLVAKHFYLNSSYLSRSFKQVTRFTFVEYLTKLRMEEAIKLIRTTDARSYQLGEMVGIQDPKYFSLCFKKYTGMTVNEFKKQISQL